MRRPCLTCGMPTLGTRCPEHSREQNAARNRERARHASTAQRGYGRSWRVLSERYRLRNPLCELRYPGCQVMAVDTDHRVPVRAGGHPAWANACATCRPCHAKKTREDAERYPA